MQGHLKKNIPIFHNFNTTNELKDKREHLEKIFYILIKTGMEITINISINMLITFKRRKIWSAKIGLGEGGEKEEKK